MPVATRTCERPSRADYVEGGEQGGGEEGDAEVGQEHFGQGIDRSRDARDEAGGQDEADQEDEENEAAGGSPSL